MKQTALITGSSAGIGAEIAVKLSEKGYQVFLAGRNEERLIEQANQCSAEGYFTGDLSKPENCIKLYESAIEKLGRIDILVNNAGEYIWSPIEKTEEDKISQVIKLNLEVPFRLCKLVVPNMKKQGWGRIINIGSISGVVGEANASLYSVSKAGLIGLTKSLALELAEYGITVNLVNPGWVRTELCTKILCEEKLEEEIEAVPQKRWIHPSEVAELVKYIASEEARGITGQSINLCAGLSLG